MIISGSAGVLLLAHEVWRAHDVEHRTRELAALAHLSSLYEAGRLREFIALSYLDLGWRPELVNWALNEFTDEQIKEQADKIIESYGGLSAASYGLEKAAARMVRLRRRLLALGVVLLIASYWLNLAI